MLCQDLRELQKLMKEGQKNDDPFKRQFFVKSMEIQKESCLKKVNYLHNTHSITFKSVVAKSCGSITLSIFKETPHTKN